MVGNRFSVKNRTLVLLAVLCAPALIGCRNAVEETFTSMNELEERIDEETLLLESVVRTLSANWDISSLEQGAADTRRRFKDLIRERYQIQSAFEKGDASKVDTLRLGNDFVKKAQAFLDDVVARRRRVETMKEMTDTSSLKLTELAERMSTANQFVGAIRSADEKMVLEAKLMAIDKAIGDARQLLETGMKQVQKDPGQARVIFDTGMNQLNQVDVTLTEYTEDVRKQLVDQEAAGKG